MQKDVWQRVEIVTDLDMAIHAQHRKDNERLHVLRLSFYIPEYGLLQISQA